MAALVLTEKRAVAEAIAAAFGWVSGDGCYQGRFNGVPVYVTWASGNLYELKGPDEMIPGANWSDPRTLMVEPSSNLLEYLTEARDKHAQDTLRNLKRQFARTDLDRIVIATDPDPAGEQIGRDIVVSLVPVDRLRQIRLRRLLLNHGLEAEDVRRAFRDIQPAVNTVLLWYVNQARAYADWNFQLITRSYTCMGHLGILGEELASGKTPKERVVSVGRVQTPTLRLVVDRDRLIAKFKKIEHYKLYVTVNGRQHEYIVSTPDLEVRQIKGVAWDERADSPTPLFIDRPMVEQWRQVTEQVGRGRIKGQAAETQSAAPKCFSLTSLQREMSKRHKYTANQTLKHTSELYLKKFVSYPRTEHEELPISEYELAPELLKGLVPVAGDGPIQRALEHIEFMDKPPRAYSKKSMEHHGLRPTKKVPSKADVSEAEWNTYQVIMQRYVEAHLPPVRTMTHSHVILVGVSNPLGEPRSMFRRRDKFVIDPGWKAAFQGVTVDPVPALMDGVVSFEEVGITAAKTAPPPKFTEDTLLGAMLNAGRFAENEADAEDLKAIDGIGTPATRHTIIEKLLLRNYIKRSKKGVITSTPRGQALIDQVPEELSSVSMTAMWERKARVILESRSPEEGRQRRGDFLAEERRNLLRELQANVERIQSAGINLDEITQQRPSGAAPSEKQIEYVRKSAEQLGITPPPEALTDRKAASDFIDECLAKYPPTAKQLNFAQKLAIKAGVELPAEAQNTAKGCREFIDRHAKPGHRGKATASRG